MSAAMQITGLDAIAKRVAALPKELLKGAETAALRSGGKLIRDRAKSLAPKDSGALRFALKSNVRTIHGFKSARIGARISYMKQVTRKNRHGQKYTLKKARPVKYVHLVELGTSHSVAKPFIRPAVEQTKAYLPQVMGAALAAHLPKAVAKLRQKYNK